MAENRPWDGVERRKADAPLGVTALNIAARAANDGRTEVSEIFENTGKAANNMVRKGDFNNQPLQSRVGAILDAAKVESQLTPEQAAETLRIFEGRFASKEGQKLHEGIGWARVKASLESNPKALWSINAMQEKGHQPDVYFSDGGGFDVGTTTKEAPEEGRNCVFDEAAVKDLLARNPEAVFNGSAMAMAKEMGIDLMAPDQYRNGLQKNGKFDLNTRVWLKTDKSTRKTGLALNGYRNFDDVSVNQINARYHNVSGSWRGSLRVDWAA